MGFWRSFLRRNMKPIPRDHAIKMKNRWSALYFLATWNLFGYAIYLWTKESLPSKTELEPTTKYYSKLLGLEQGRIYHFRGTELVDEFDNPTPNLKLPPKFGQSMENSESDEKTLPNENLELLVEETGSL